MPKRQRLITLVIMGVAGAGKSTLMEALHQRLGWATLEGDTMHPYSNVARMSAGLPLRDAHREAWLASIAARIGQLEGRRQSSIVTCSALRRAYRDVIRQGHPSVWFIHLEAPEPELRRRLEDRQGHFMPPSLLRSQLETLEPLGPGEPGTTVDGAGSPDQLAEELIERLRLERRVAPPTPWPGSGPPRTRRT